MAPHSYIYYYKRRQAQGSARPDLIKEQKHEGPPIIDPVVLPAPDHGRKAIYVNSAHTMKSNELPEAEGAALLAQLFEHVAKSNLVYRHKWQPADLIIWVDSATQHLGVDDYALPQATDASRHRPPTR